MSTAKRCDAAACRPETYATVLGKLLAAAIIVTPLVAMLFPELNHRSGNNATSSRRGLESRTEFSVPPIPVQGDER
jgi:hypothetical protein